MVGDIVLVSQCHGHGALVSQCHGAQPRCHGAMLPCKCISLNNTSSDQSGSPNTTAGITQCHAAAHTCSLSSPTLSSNRDKQHEICCDSALHGPGLLQDRTQGWLAPSLLDELHQVSNEEENIQKIDAISKTLPKAQRTQGIEYSESVNTFCSKQKLQQALHLGQKSAWFCLAKGEK